MKPIRIVIVIGLLASSAFAGPSEDLTAAYERGRSFYAAERFGEAAAEFERAIALAPRVYGANDRTNTSKLKEFLASCRLEEYRLVEAEQLFKECLAVARADEGDRGARTLDVRNNLGLVYDRLHLVDDAEREYRFVLDGDPTAAGRATAALSLGYLWVTHDRLDEAETMFLRAEREWPAGSDRASQLHAASVHHGIGKTLLKQSRPREAGERFARALIVRRKHLPAGHRFIAHGTASLGVVMACLDRDADAEPQFRAAERSMRNVWGDDHVDVAVFEHELGLLLARRGRIGESIATFTASRRTYRRHIDRTLSGLVEEEQLRFLGDHRRLTMDALAAAYVHRDDPRFVRAGLEWALNEKGLAGETLAERPLLDRAARTNATLKRVVEALLLVRRTLAALAVAADEKQGDRRRKLLDQHAELVRRTGTRGGRGGDPWVTLGRVAGGLAQDEVLVEIVRLDRSQPRTSAIDTRDDGTSPRYVAWTLRANGDARMFDLGPAGPIDTAVETLREVLGRGINGEPKAALREVSRLVLWPLLDEIGETEQWTIAPDGPLWLVPWSALVRRDEKTYTVERAVVSQVVTGRRLVDRDTTTPANYSIALADPDYDLEPKAVDEQLASFDIEPGATTRGSSSGGAAIGKRNWRRLPGTAREVSVLHRPIERYTGGRVYVYQRSEALESLVKFVVRPRIVVIASHGFFDAEGAANPLLRCGVVLAGANVPREGNTTAEDGVLTGFEVLDADLRGTEIVVLSACDTGVGRVRDGEGVAGLRQAFHLAGAHQVVATLWTVPDTQTADLMMRFWTALPEDRSAARALCRARRTMIADLRTKHDGEAHPWLWAAATLSR